jgi:hypothetical protein
MKDNQVDQSVQEEIQCKDGRAAKLQEGGTSLRKFLGKMGTATLAAGVLGNASKAIAQMDDVSAAAKTKMKMCFSTQGAAFKRPEPFAPH